MTLLSCIYKVNEDVASQMTSIVAVDVHKSSILRRIPFLTSYKLFFILKHNTKCKGVV